MLLDRSPRKRGGLYFLREQKYEQNQTYRHQHRRIFAIVVWPRNENRCFRVERLWRRWLSTGAMGRRSRAVPPVPCGHVPFGCGTSHLRYRACERSFCGLDSRVQPPPHLSWSRGKSDGKRPLAYAFVLPRKAPHRSDCALLRAIGVHVHEKAHVLYERKRFAIGACLS